MAHTFTSPKYRKSQMTRYMLRVGTRGTGNGSAAAFRKGDGEGQGPTDRAPTGNASAMHAVETYKFAHAVVPTHKTAKLMPIHHDSVATIINTAAKRALPSMRYWSMLRSAAVSTASVPALP